MSFLKAELRNLAIANYIVDKDVVTQYIPYGTELDLWQGNCFISLIGFMFKNTRVLGVKIPFHVDFEELNLRFYVKRMEHGEMRRGVVFIKEIVPKKALTFVANTFCSENYETMPMSHKWSENETSRTIEYTWTKSGSKNKLQVISGKESFEMVSGSVTEFLIARHWGYARVTNKITSEYQLTHPKWKVYDVKDYKIEVDFGAVYGKKFDFLNALQPDSVMLDEGSEATVGNRRTLKFPYAR